MGEMNTGVAFEKLLERVGDHEKHVDERLNRTETAMTNFKDLVQRRIDALDDRIQELAKKRRRGAP